MVTIRVQFDESKAIVEPGSGRYKYWDLYRQDFGDKLPAYYLELSRVPVLGEKITVPGHEWRVTEVQHTVRGEDDFDADVFIEFVST